jgi:uncharacterized protein
MENWERLFRAEIEKIATAIDPAHDLLHFERVVKTAKFLCRAEGGNPDVVIPAAWLHDLVIIPKDGPRRSKASKLSAEAAIQFLDSIGYPKEHFVDIAHAIESHSYSANIVAQTKEAKIVQDADRLDGLGAIGIARCFATAGILKRPFYSADDPFCKSRKPDDSQFTIDHFYRKLFKTAETLQTEAGRKEGLRRVEVMKSYLFQLGSELELFYSSSSSSERPSFVLIS